MKLNKQGSVLIDGTGIPSQAREPAFIKMLIKLRPLD
jgi:hypothetical protein